MKRQHLSLTPGQDAFICRHCGRGVAVTGAGTEHRNHCPYCLYSLHVDIKPGDRRCMCHGLMEPIAVWVKTNNEWALVHRCAQCGTVKTNRLAGDDDEVVLLSFALRPLVQPAFPLERLMREKDAT